jgi:hypothetical protein
MKNRIEATKDLLGAICVFFLLIFLQIWYIITGNE